MSKETDNELQEAAENAMSEFPWPCDNVVEGGEIGILIKHILPLLEKRNAEIEQLKKDSQQWEDWCQAARGTMVAKSKELAVAQKKIKQLEEKNSVRGPGW